jgi:DNA-binding CsgD family transcriptional regulator
MTSPELIDPPSPRPPGVLRSEIEASPREPSPTKARPPFGWASLTPTEHGVIRLIADGLTNREAAARLYVSRHTIDAHLRSIFRKLGINSRVRLARITASMSAPATAESF